MSPRAFSAMLPSKKRLSLDRPCVAIRDQCTGVGIALALPGNEIISMGKKTPAGLIAMCSYGRSGVRRWVLGSVTETMVRQSGEPVLIMRAPR